MLYINTVKNTIKFRTKKSAAVDEWMMKEEGSYEDSKGKGIHVYSILKRFGGMVELTKEEAKVLIQSAEYQSTAWQADEIRGGAATMRVIAQYGKQVKKALSSF